MRARGALLAAVLVAQAVPAGAAPQILLRSGDAAADGLRLDGFRLPVASSAGQVALLATTSGILREDGGVLSVVAKTGDPLPAPLQGTFGALANASIADGGATFQRIGPAVVNNHGLVAFAANVRGGPGGIYTWDATSGLAVAAEEGEASPISGASYSSFNGRDDVSINDGQLAFVAGLTGSAAAGVFVRDLAGGATAPVA